MDKKKVSLIIEIVLFVGALCAITGFYYFGGEDVEEQKKESEKVGIVKINDDNYESEIEKYENIVLLEFSSNSCPPCLTMIPTMNSIAKNHKDIKVANVNTSEDNTEDVAKKYNVEAYPTIFIVKNGEVVKSFVGATGEETILNEIRQAEEK